MKLKPIACLRSLLAQVRLSKPEDFSQIGWVTGNSNSHLEAKPYGPRSFEASRKPMRRL